MDTPAAQAPAIIKTISDDPSVPTPGPDIDLQATFQELRNSGAGDVVPVDHDPKKPFGWVDHALYELISPKTREDNGKGYREFDYLPDELKHLVADIVKRRFGDGDRTIQPHELTHVRNALEKRGITMVIKAGDPMAALRAELESLRRQIASGAKIG